MTSLTAEEEALIQDKPLSARVRENASRVALCGENHSECQVAVANLILSLMEHSVAQGLRIMSGPVDLSLAPIYTRVRSGAVDLSSFTQLAALITRDADDVKVWKAVLNLIPPFSRTPSPSFKSIPPTFNGTPRTYSSASYRDSVQTRRELEEVIRQELAGRTYIDVQGFFEKYFESKPWSELSDQIYAQATEDAALHSLFNKIRPEEQDVWEWLDGFQTRYLSQARNVYYRTTSQAAFKDAQGQRQLDILLKSRTASTEEPHSVRDTQVVGELTRSQLNVWKGKYLQLATYVRDMFAAQPTRWFVHGFLMFGFQMQLWVFDRSGAYGTELFDIREQPKRFIQVIVGYVMMSDFELGVSPVIQHKGPRNFVTITDTATGKDLELYLESKPFMHQNAIACRGTTCFRTEDGSQVVKMSWRSDKPQSEVDLLKIARGVKGIPWITGSRDMTTIDQLRLELDIKTRRKLGAEQPERFNHSSALSSARQSVHAPAKPDTNSLKRKSDSTDRTSLKKRRSSRVSYLRHKSEADGARTSKPSGAAAGAGSGSSSPEHLPHRNRVFTCLAIRPVGRPLQNFRSVIEVLEAFRDAIKAHQSLFLDRKILHRDISMNNIILTDSAQNDGCVGMLIDLDMAVLVGEDGKNQTSGEQNMTGTLEYMALQILECGINKGTAGVQHTYRHDLESFFYVLLSVCIRCGWGDDKPGRDVLRGWYEGPIETIHRVKAGDVGICFETTILQHFSPMFQGLKALARMLRDILFTKGMGYVETPEDPSTLYGPMIRAFEFAIHNARQQVI